MTQSQAEIINEKVVFKGFNQINEYDLKVRSLKNPDKLLPPMNREVFHVEDAVAVLIYVRSADSFLICQQFRTGVFFNEEGRDPFIFEIPAGMIEKGLSPKDTALKEVEEETGLKIEHVEQFQIAYNSTGRMTEKTYLYYAEVDSIPNTGMYGVEDEGEEIKTHLIPREKVYEMIKDGTIIHAQTLLALYWYRTVKDDKK